MIDGEIKRMLQSLLFKREWKNFAGEFQSDRDFYKYVENLQRKVMSESALRLWKEKGI